MGARACFCERSFAEAAHSSSPCSRLRCTDPPSGSRCRAALVPALVDLCAAVLAADGLIELQPSFDAALSQRWPALRSRRRRRSRHAVCDRTSMITVAGVVFRLPSSPCRSRKQYSHACCATSCRIARPRPCSSHLSHLRLLPDRAAHHPGAEDAASYHRSLCSGRGLARRRLPPDLLRHHVACRPSSSILERIANETTEAIAGCSEELGGRTRPRTSARI